MRWMWIDRVIELVRGERLVAVKGVSLAEDHLHDHFAERRSPSGVLEREACPVMPGSLIVEGMAQTAGILVGHATDFREKVILAKVSKAKLECDAPPGTTLRYTAEIANHGTQGAATRGRVELLDHGEPGGEFRQIGRIDLMFSQLDRNLAGMEFPEHNFVFGDAFKTLLRSSGIDCPD